MSKSDAKLIKKLNDIGGRMEWVRLKLAIPLSRIAKELEIPYTTYWEREKGSRTEHVEEYLVIANHLDVKWQEKYNSNYPSFHGQELRRITPNFIMFGEIDPEKEEIQKLKEALIKHQLDSIHREADLYNQIRILSNEVLK